MTVLLLIIYVCQCKEDEREEMIIIEERDREKDGKRREDVQGDREKDGERRGDRQRDREKDGERRENPSRVKPSGNEKTRASCTPSLGP